MCLRGAGVFSTTSRGLTTFLKRRNTSSGITPFTFAGWQPGCSHHSADYFENMLWRLSTCIILANLKGLSSRQVTQSYLSRIILLILD